MKRRKGGEEGVKGRVVKGREEKGEEEREGKSKVEL